MKPEPPVPSQDLPTQPETAVARQAVRHEAYELAAQNCDALGAIAKAKLRSAEREGNAVAIKVWQASLVACEACAKRVRALEETTQETHADSDETNRKEPR